MRLLFSLILTHCFSCLVLKKLANELEYEKLYDLGSKKTAFNSIILIIQKRSNLSPFRYKNSTNFHRKLLSYSDNELYENPMKGEQPRKLHTQLHEREQKVFLKDVGSLTGSQSELWDEWGNWSTCSVTCGSGRQVRWRHCSAEHCMKGLKKAQIKTCRLKDCDKNILNWLGIKSTS